MGMLVLMLVHRFRWVGNWLLSLRQGKVLWDWNGNKGSGLVTLLLQPLQLLQLVFMKPRLKLLNLVVIARWCLKEGK